MQKSKLLARKLINLKFEAMIQEINKLYSICNMLFGSSKNKEIKSLEIIKEQYFQIYNKVIEAELYEKYKEIEEIIIKEIAKIELNIERYIKNTFQSFEEIMKNNIKSIYESKNYQEFSNLDQEIKNVETLEEILRLYTPYISENEAEQYKKEIAELKFNVLYRKQIEQLIYQDDRDNNNLTKYNSNYEREIFERLLKKKIENNNLFTNVSKRPILEDRKLIERLIIIDMKKNPFTYINIIKAKVFNAHLCNIANDPFGKYYQVRPFGLEKENRVNYSLLVAILKNIITDKNISIIECEYIYQKFGFKCRPILLNIGQQCVKMVFNEVKGSKEYEEYINNLIELKQSRKNTDKKYCKIDFECLVYEFDDEDYIREDSLNECIAGKNTKLVQNMERRKEHVKNNGIITMDIDIIILLIKDVIKQYNNSKNKIIKNSEKENEEQSCKNRIEEYKDIIKWLEELKNKKGKYTLNESKKLLLIINDIYKELNIRYNSRRVIPLECMTSENSGQVDLVPLAKLPIAHETDDLSSFSNILRKKDILPLWKKYEAECKDLGIHVTKWRNEYNEGYPKFEILIKLDDILDLPIDDEKAQLLKKEEKEEKEEIKKREKCIEINNSNVKLNTDLSEQIDILTLTKKPLVYSKLTEEEKKIVDKYILEIDPYNIMEIYKIGKNETEQISKELELLKGMLKAHDISIENMSNEIYKRKNVSPNIDIIGKNVEIRKIQVKTNAVKIEIITHDLAKLYCNLQYKIIALQEVEKKIQEETAKKRIKKQIDILEFLSIDLKNNIIILSQLAQGDDVVSSNYEQDVARLLTLESLDDFKSELSEKSSENKDSNVL